MVTVPLQEMMPVKPRTEYITEEFVEGLFSPFVMHPALKEAANAYGVPAHKKKFFTADNWVAVSKEVSCRAWTFSYLATHL